MATNRAGQTSLTHIYWDAYSSSGDTMTKSLLDGLSNKPVSELVVLAKSWLSPPKLEATGEEFRSAGYDPTQRSYVVSRVDKEESASLDMTLEARGHADDRRKGRWLGQGLPPWVRAPAERNRSCDLASNGVRAPGTIVALCD